MESPWALGIMSYALIIVPIMGIYFVHKYGWEHWEPFSHEPHTKTTK